jgi:hypothetical protein
MLQVRKTKMALTSEDKFSQPASEAMAEIDGSSKALLLDFVVPARIHELLGGVQTNW